MKYEINTVSDALQVDIQKAGEQLKILYKDQDLQFEAVPVQPGVYSILMDHRSFVVGICPTVANRVNVNGTPVIVELLDSIHLHLRDLGWDTAEDQKEGLVVAQIPGLITRIFHQIGDIVDPGDPLFLMEAMKMENEIKAPVGGTIKKISVREGQTVEKGTKIIEIG